MQYTRNLLLFIARSSIGQRTTGWIFTHMSFVLPLKRLRDSKTLVAFHHPSPGYPVHILIVPKKAIANLSGLTNQDRDFMVELFSTVKDLVHELELEKSGYRLIVNGGSFQEVPQLHFHLIAEHPVTNRGKEKGEAGAEGDGNSK